eukprot:scaffold229478_cov43-Tisochrysis_lutea.AAC.1
MEHGCTVDRGSRRACRQGGGGWKGNLTRRRGTYGMTLATLPLHADWTPRLRPIARGAQSHPL